MPDTVQTPATEALVEVRIDLERAAYGTFSIDRYKHVESIFLSGSQPTERMFEEDPQPDGVWVKIGTWGELEGQAFQMLLMVFKVPDGPDAETWNATVRVRARATEDTPDEQAASLYEGELKDRKYSNRDIARASDTFVLTVPRSNQEAKP